MKRKLLFLFVAFLAIAGFQQLSAQLTERLVVIHAADSTAATNNYSSTVPDADINSKLTYSSTIIYEPAPTTVNTKAGSADRFEVKQSSGNTIIFTSINGGKPLQLTSGNTTYGQFTVFKDNAPFSQDFNDGDFSGYLAANFSNDPTADGLLLVVQNKAGTLQLMSYKDYLAQAKVTTNKTSQTWFPLYIKTEVIAGRWAIPADFAGCKYYTFTWGSDKLTVYSAEETEAGTTKTPFNAFAVQQVDYIYDGSSTDANNLVNVKGATFQGLGTDINGTANTDPYFGTMDDGNLRKVIPLFKLSTPQNDCKVLSVSRQNDYTTQSQNVGVVGNKLEVRDYGEFYYYDQDNDNEYTSKTLEAGEDYNGVGYVDYTSLQKFAIWIDEDGNMVLYPVASYAWTYGQSDTERQEAADAILPNAVLTWNDIQVQAKTTMGADEYNSKINGVQIGWWNGQNTTGVGGQPAKSVTPYVGTAFNNLQNTTDYKLVSLLPDCAETTKDLSGRFFFLQVLNPDTTGMWNSKKPNYNADFAPGKFQYQREYVLATQVGADNYKHLVVVPKEQLRSTEDEYWNFPYDSVNMAAHWEVQAAGGDYKNGYILINMLGDTLQYNIDFTNTPSPYYVNYLTGGFMPVNSLIPGSPNNNSGTAANGEDKYFNSNTPDKNWFDPNPLNSYYPSLLGSGGYQLTWNTWTFRQLADPYKFGLNAKGDSYGADAFALELNIGDKYDFSVGLKLNGWAKSGTGSVGSGVGTTYWQQGTDLDFVDNSTLHSYTTTSEIPSCGGLMISLQPISYVPTYGPFYPGEPQDAIINTGEPGKTNTFQKADSLTAYSFLEGNYEITEAIGVQPTDADLKLGAVARQTNDGRTVHQARLINTSDTQTVQFIPLDGAIGAQRSDLIKATGATENAIDLLYGETYKWYLVKLGDSYLTFDTVNVAASVNRQKVGLVFDADLANATPVRLYQPLVGDKANNNFLIQFYMPLYTYYPNATNNDPKFVKNEFPLIDTNSSTTIGGGGQVCFATIVDQTNYIYAVRAYAGVGASGTRFTWLAKENTQQCVPNFIDPAWMGENRLLNLPLNNQVWVSNAAVNAWIATDTTAEVRSIVSNDTAKIAAATLTHTYVNSINLKAPYDGKVALPNGVTLTGFQTDLEVPLYYVQNDEGLYLTVVDNTEMRSDNATASDVSGIRLEWQKKIEWSNKTDSALWHDYGIDRQALQMFAINGCKDNVDGWFGKFVYLPLASFKANYSDGSIVKTSDGKAENVYYNLGLGKGVAYGGGSDVTSCWRISQWAPTQLPTKDLIVFNSQNATGSPVVGLVPVEFKLSKQEYLKPDCEYFLVKTLYGSGKTGTYIDLQNNTDTVASSNSLFAHWSLVPDKDDEFMFTFAPEVQTVYGDEVGIGKTIAQKQLLGQYYFVKPITVNGETGYLAIDVSGYNDGKYAAVFDTLQLTCTDHTLPFFDLEKDAGYSMNNSLAILETPLVDRNLTDVFNKIMTPIYHGKDKIGYQTYIDTCGVNFRSARYLTVYKVYERYLSDDGNGNVHAIPYYAFSVTEKETGGTNVEYFLNVYTNSTTKSDSVYWSKLDNNDVKAKLLDGENNPTFMTNYKFCLPKQVKADGSPADLVKYGDNAYPPVYLQTLDSAKTDYPFLLITGSASNYVTAKRLNAIIPGDATTNSLRWNIYTVDYRYVDPNQVTKWIFGGQIPNGQVWVPLADVTDKVGNTKAGVLTSLMNGGGLTYVNQSGKTPVNIGVLSGVKDNPNLTVEFAGDTTIGTYMQSRIWYYKISLEDQDGNPLYLTDATPQTADDYFYTVLGEDRPYGYFTDLDEKTPYVDLGTKGITADKSFVQTFGFRYVNDDSFDPDQPFYVVSNANFTNKPAHENEYRYLAQINEQLVFVEDPTNALVFQWGNVDDSGYTNLDVVGVGNIYGVDGGIKCVNTTGKVDIYSIDGRLIKSAVVTGNDQIITAPRGIAIVKNGAKVVKVVVK